MDKQKSLNPLQITEEDTKEVKKVVQYAEHNKYNIEMIKEIMDGKREPAGLNSEHVKFFHVDYRVVYSIEEHPMGWCRHLSVSVSNKDRYPNPAAVQRIMEVYGITVDINNPEEAFVYEEKDNYTPIGQQVNAINIITKY